MDEETLRRRLQALGLSTKEVAVYLGVLDHGETKVSAVAETADVSRRYVYSLAGNLEDRGFVEVNDHRSPTTIRALPPEEVVDSWKESLEELSDELEARRSTETVEQGDVSIIRSRRTALAELSAIIQRAEREVVLSIPYSLYDNVRADLRDCVGRGVTVLLMLSGESAETIASADLDGVATVVTVFPHRSPVQVCADRYGVGLVPRREMFSSRRNEFQAVAVREDAVVRLLREAILSTRWPVAEQVHVEAPTALPATFETFHHAVIHATIHRRAGNEVVATVETNERWDQERTLSGPVVETRQGYVHPPTNEFPYECAMELETAEGVVSVGGDRAVAEDVAADAVTLDAR